METNILKTFDKKLIQALPTDTIKDLLIFFKEELRQRKKTCNITKRRNFIQSLDITRYDSFELLSKAINKYNTKLLSLPNLNNKPDHRHKYLTSLIMQDWSDLYHPKDSLKDFYVYAHVDPADKIFLTNKKNGGNYGGMPFYIGKGIGNRAYNLNRNQGHGKKIRSIKKEGWNDKDIVKIIFNNLSEYKAYELESKLIYFFGTIYQKDRTEGVLYNLDVPKIPDYICQMQKIQNRKQFDTKSIC